MGKYIVDWIREPGEDYGEIVVVYRNDDGTWEKVRDDCKNFKTLNEVADKLDELNSICTGKQEK